MSTKRKIALAVILLLLALSYLYWRTRQEPEPPVPPPPIEQPPPPPVVEPVAPPPKVEKPARRPHKPVPPPAPKPAPPPAAQGPVPTTIPAPPKITLHPELIPKNIDIVRCYYGQEIMGPDTTFGFDINGSGFTNEFQNMIRIDPGGLDIEVKNLRLVTANQIHGDMVVGSAQTTAFIYPKVLIRDLPVFRAPDPFAVVRRGEVLGILFVSLSDDGRSGRFRVITNLDETMQKQFRVTASHPGLEVSSLEFHLPFDVQGVLQIGAAVPQGEYGMSAHIGQREIWKRDGMIRIVRPNIGSTGFVQGVSADDRYRRPGDTVHLYLHGSGLTQAYTTNLSAKVNEFDMGPATFEFISASQMRFSFTVPQKAPLTAYGITLYDNKKKELFKKDDVFTLVPANWIGGIQIAPPPKPGQNGLLRILGRDLSAQFVSDLQLSTDDPGLVLKNIRQLDPSTIGADLFVSTSVAPGDYWIHLIAQGKEIQPPFGSLIKIEAP